MNFGQGARLRIRPGFLFTCLWAAVAAAVPVPVHQNGPAAVRLPAWILAQRHYFYSGRQASMSRQDWRRQISAGPAYLRQANIVEIYRLRLDQISTRGLDRETVQRLFYVATGQGARELGDDDVWYDAAREHFHWGYARIYRHGRMVGQGQDDGAGQPATSGTQDRKMAFPGLQPGDIVSLAYWLTPRNARTWRVWGRKYIGDIYALRGDHATLRSRLVVQSRLPLFVAQSRLPAPRPARRGRNEVWAWQAGPLPAFYSESHGPSITDRSPYVQWSSFAGWRKLAQWYSQRLRARIEISSALRQRWLQLAPPGGTPRETVQKVWRALARRLFYYGDEIGIHAFLPASPGEVFHARRGDCKDGALLLSTWLRMEGIPAELAMLRTRRMGAMANAAATLSAFDHAIVYIPAGVMGRRARWIDTTAPEYQTRALPPSDQGAIAMLVPIHLARGKTARIARAQSVAFHPLTPRPPGLIKVPYATSAHNLARRNFRLRFLRLHGAWQLRILGQWSFRGADAPAMRSRYGAPLSRQENLRAWMSRNFPGARLESTAAEGLAADASTFRLRFTAAAAWPPARDWRTPWTDWHVARQLAFTARRHDRLRLRSRWRRQDDWQVSWPATLQAPGLPPCLPISTRAQLPEVGSWKLRETCRPGNWRIFTQVTQSAISIPAPQYLQFRHFWRQADLRLDAVRPAIVQKMQNPGPLTAGPAPMEAAAKATAAR